MSIFNFWKNKKSRHIEPSQEWPKAVAPELPISCIAQHIIDDLDIKNIDKWKIKNTSYDYYLDNDKYKVNLIKQGNPDGSSFSRVYLTGIDYKFNNREQKLLVLASNLLFDELFEVCNKEYKLKNDEKLKELFPDCFK